MDKELNEEVWRRLAASKPLDGLGLAIKDDRFDLAGLTNPAPVVTERIQTPVGEVGYLSGITEFKNVRWVGMDFTGARLEGLRFFDCAIANCVFDKCRAEDWRVWATSFTDTTFRKAVMEGALGTAYEGRRCLYRNVDFTGANLRQAGFQSAELVNCQFRNTKLDKMDFQSSTLTDCTFEGMLDDVAFRRHGFQGESFPPNEMVRVDFRKARLQWVAFDNLDLDSVQFPQDDEHVVFRDVQATVDRLIRASGENTDPNAHLLLAYFERMKSRLSRNQKQAVINKLVLSEYAGEELTDAVLSVIKPAGS